MLVNEIEEKVGKEGRSGHGKEYRTKHGAEKDVDVMEEDEGSASKKDLT